MKRYTFLIITIFFLSTHVLLGQREMKNFVVKGESRLSPLNYFIYSKNGLPEEIIVKTWIFSIRTKDYDLMDPLWKGIVKLLENEKIVACDSNFSFGLGLFYNQDQVFCDLFLNISVEHFDCYPESFLDDLYHLADSLSPTLPARKLLDRCLVRVNKEKWSRSNGYAEFLFRIDRALFDRMKAEEYKDL